MRNFGLINRTGGGGFFSNFFISLSLALDVEEKELIPYIVSDQTMFTKYNKNDKNDKNSWNWWFDQEIPNLNDNIIKMSYSNDDNFFYFPPPFYHGSNIYDVTKLWDRDEINKSRLFFNTFFKIKEHILEKSNFFFEKYMKEKINLGVMARGTEFNMIHPQYGNQTVYDYINKIKNVMLNYPEIDNIFVVTEDGDYIKIFENELDNVKYMNVFRRTHQSLEYCKHNWEWPYQYNLREDHTKILGDECLYQTLLLGKCDYLVCKENSISAGAIFFRENIKDVFYV